MVLAPGPTDRPRRPDEKESDTGGIMTLPVFFGQVRQVGPKSATGGNCQFITDGGHCDARLLRKWMNKFGEFLTFLLLRNIAVSEIFGYYKQLSNVYCELLVFKSKLIKLWHFDSLVKATTPLKAMFISRTVVCMSWTDNLENS